MKPKDIQYVKYIVNRYIHNKPELWDLREDLEQEGNIAWLKADEKYTPGGGMNRNRFLYYHIKQDIQDYLRDVEIPHFQKPPADDSAYWDLGEVPNVDEIPDESEENDIRYSLSEMLSGVVLTTRQSEVLELYFEGWTYREIGEKLGINFTRVNQIMGAIVHNVRRDNDLAYP